jgi:hypothetical protein
VDGSFDACATAELAETIGQLHALEAAVHRVLLAALASFDRRYGWEEDGATSAVAWLTGMLGVSWRTASDWLEVAKALEDLPATAAAYGEGRLSADQVRALVTFATPESEADLAQAAAGWSAAHTAAIARRARPVTPEEADDAQRRRSLRMWWGEDRCLHVRGRLPDAAGAVVVQAVERIADQAPPDPATGLFEPYESRCADALVTMAAGQVSADPDVDRATVVVHADVWLLTGEGAGPAEIDGGPVVAAETARRLACDGRVQLVVNDGQGRSVGVGRTTRTVPPWLARLVRRRDGGCRFPGCDRERWIDAHHVVHWGHGQGGRTDLGNLVSLCRVHHRQVHEGGWGIEGEPDGDLNFLRPDGGRLAHRPPVVAEELRGRFLAGVP